MGRGNPYERFGAGRYGAALLDLMVGEPVAHATGSSELKAIGPSRTVSNSPITKSQREIVCGGVPQTLLFGDEDVAQGRPQSDDELAARTIAAHRSYLNALIVWERALHAIGCNLCQPPGLSSQELVEIAEHAEAEKERWRVAFRDLTAELGYVPRGEGIALPDQEHGCECQESASAAALSSRA